MGSSPGPDARVRISAFVIAVALIVSTAPSFAQSGNEVWLTANVGAPLLSGKSSIYCPGTSSCVINVNGAGADIGGASDQFAFVYETLTGDGVLVTRVDSLQRTHDQAKAGLMIRESLQPGAKHASALLLPDRSVAFQRRPSTNGVTSNTGAAASAAAWLKLERVGSTFTAYRSTDGVSWIKVATDTIEMGPTVYAGLAVTSHNPSLMTTAKFSAPGASALLPAPWQAEDLGATQVPGSTFHISGSFLTYAAGRDISDNSDAFRYTFRRVSGDVDIVARVASLQKLDAATRAGLMIRGSLSATAMHGSVLATPSKGVGFQRRTTEAGVTARTDGGASATPVWLKLERRGDRITAFRSVDGVGWTFIGDDVVALPTDVYVGIALASHVPTQTAYAIFDRVTVRVLPGANKPPTVALTSPANGTVVKVGTPLALAATASDTDGSVKTVDFLVNGTLSGSDVSAPYGVNWTPTAGGVFTITAVARDDAGASTTSAPVVVTVQAPVSAARILSFTPSPDHATSVDYYELEIFKAGTATSGPALLVHSIGKPAVIAGEVSADVTQVLTSLASGSYTAVVNAVGAGGASRSAPSPAFTR